MRSETTHLVDIAQEVGEEGAERVEALARRAADDLAGEDSLRRRQGREGEVVRRDGADCGQEKARVSSRGQERGACARVDAPTSPWKLAVNVAVPSCTPRFDKLGMAVSVTRAMPFAESRGKSGRVMVTPGRPSKARKPMSLLSVTSSKMVASAYTRSLSVETVQVKLRARGEEEVSARPGGGSRQRARRTRG